MPATTAPFPPLSSAFSFIFSTIFSIPFVNSSLLTVPSPSASIVPNSLVLSIFDALASGFFSSGFFSSSANATGAARSRAAVRASRRNMFFPRGLGVRDGQVSEG